MQAVIQLVFVKLISTTSFGVVVVVVSGEIGGVMSSDKGTIRFSWHFRIYTQELYRESCTLMSPARINSAVERGGHAEFIEGNLFINGRYLN